MNEKNTLNILNGQSMYNYFKKHHLDGNGEYIPFNEAMCVGKATADIFSHEFNKYRCKAHNITMEQYKEHTLKPLHMLFENRFSDIILWFDDDMFCQINLLTLLAYLDQINYLKKITFNLVGCNFKLLQCFNFSVQGYNEIYNQVMISKSIPQNLHLPIMKNGIYLYFEYLKEENEITEYIKTHEDLENGILLRELLKIFIQYGLGDTQYMQLIERYRNNNIGKIMF